MERKKNIDVSDFSFDQLFGSKDSADNAQDEDLISIVKFDQTGYFLALGDHAGRVIIFKNESHH